MPLADNWPIRVSNSIVKKSKIDFNKSDKKKEDQLDPLFICCILINVSF